MLAVAFVLSLMAFVVILHVVLGGGPLAHWILGR